MQQQHRQDDPIPSRREDVAGRESVGKCIEEDVENAAEEEQEEVAAARRPWYQTRRWGTTLLLVYAVLLALFGLLAWVVYFHPILAPDVTITHVFQEDQSAWLRATMLAVSTIGDVQVLSASLSSEGTTSRYSPSRAINPYSSRSSRMSCAARLARAPSMRRAEAWSHERRDVVIGSGNSLCHELRE